MVVENEDQWSIPLLFDRNSDECEICGKLHKVETCTLIECPITHVKDTITPSYARLTLPEGLEVRELTDGVRTVVATKTFDKGIQFGPFIAKTSTLMDVRIEFPLKIFLSEEENVYLETYDELFCNWMCLVTPASSYEDQNLLCYQVKTSIYFCTLREIEQGQELRVWYSPYYAVRMGVTLFSKPIDMVHSSDEEFQEIFTSLQNGAEPQDHTYSPKLKKRRKFPKRPVLGENYYRAVPPSDVLPAVLLGAKQSSEEWICKTCGQLETNVASYARHLMEHYRLPAPKTFYCPYCPRWFRKDGYNRRVHIDHCKKQNERVKVLESVADNTNQTATLSENVSGDGSWALSEQSKTNDAALASLGFYESGEKSYILLGNVSLVNVDNNRVCVDINSSSSSPSKEHESRYTDNNDNKNNTAEKSLSNECTSSKPFFKTQTPEDENTGNICNKDADDFPSENNTDIRCWSNVNQSENCEKDLERIKVCSSKVQDKSRWNTNETDKNMNLESLAENILSKSVLNPPILDLSDDIDFNITKTFSEMISDDCNLEKSISFPKSNRSLDLFDNVTGQGLLTPAPQNPCLDTSPFYCPGKSGFLESNFTSCEDVTDEERNRIVENLLSESEDKFVNNTDYEMTEGCVSEHPEPEINNVDRKENEKMITDQMKVKPKNEDFKCDICEKCFGKQLYLFRHLRKHTGEFRCNVCYMVFARKETLQTHRLTCPQEMTTQSAVTRMRVHCKFCKMQFHSLSTLQEHIKSHYCTGNTWKCTCKKISSDLKLIENHNCRQSKTSITCVECCKVFTSAMEFADHKNHIIIRKKTKKDLSTMCEICGMTFKTCTGVRLHRSTHGEKKFACTVCGKRFVRNDVMLEHRTRHDNNYNLECSECGKRLRTKRDFNAHLRIMHMGIKFTCPYCDKIFSQKGNLKKHLKIHSSTFDFPCKLCKKEFNSKAALQNHVVISHSCPEPTKSFQCNLCSRKYHVNHLLKTHIRRAHTEMFRCAYCGMNIRYCHTLKKHLSSKHSEKTDEWNNPEAIKAMMGSQSDTISKKAQKNKEVDGVCNQSIKDILQTVAISVLEDNSIPSKNNEPNVVDNVIQEVLNLPLDVVDNFQITDQETTISSSSPQGLLPNPEIGCTQGDSNAANLESSVVNFPFNLPEGYQLVLSDNQVEKVQTSELPSEDSIGNLQNINGASAFVLTDGSIIQPGLSLENNVFFYIVDTSASENVL